MHWYYCETAICASIRPKSLTCVNHYGDTRMKSSERHLARLCTLFADRTYHGSDISWPPSMGRQRFIFWRGVCLICRQLLQRICQTISSCNSCVGVLFVKHIRYHKPLFMTRTWHWDRWATDSSHRCDTLHWLGKLSTWHFAIALREIGRPFHRFTCVCVASISCY